MTRQTDISIALWTFIQPFKTKPILANFQKVFQKLPMYQKYGKIVSEMDRFSWFFVNLTILWLAGCKHSSQRNIFLVSDWLPDSVQNHSFLISSKIEREIPDFLTLKTKFHGIGSFLSKTEYENRTREERWFVFHQ